MLLSWPINRILVKLICLFAVAFARGPAPEDCHFCTSLLHQCRRQRVETLRQQGPPTSLLTPTGWLLSSALTNVLQVLLKNKSLFLPLYLTHRESSKCLKQASYCQPRQKRLAPLSPEDIIWPRLWEAWRIFLCCVSPRGWRQCEQSLLALTCLRHSPRRWKRSADDKTTR